MLSQPQKEQLNRLLEALEVYKKSQIDHENLHKLRVECRRTMSIFEDFKGSLFYADVRKIMKLSNPIRDYDVMFGVTIEGMPQKLKEKLDSISIHEHLNVRKKDLETTLLKYLDGLALCEKDTQKEAPRKNLKPKIISKDKVIFHIPSKKLKYLTSEELHKIRIEAKKARYYLESHFDEEREIIALFKSIQEKLGCVHDNDVCLEFLKNELKGNKKLLTEIKHYFTKKNNKLIAATQMLVESLKQML